MIRVWKITSFDPAVPMNLQLVLESDEPRTAELVEQAAHNWGVELEPVQIESDLQALVTGAIAGGLVRMKDLPLDVRLRTDAEGNYLPELYVTGRSGTRLRISVTVVEPKQ